MPLVLEVLGPFFTLDLGQRGHGYRTGDLEAPASNVLVNIRADVTCPQVCAWASAMGESCAEGQRGFCAGGRQPLLMQVSGRLGVVGEGGCRVR